MVTRPQWVNLGVRELGANLEGGDLVGGQNKRLVIFFNSLYEVLGSAHDQSIGFRFWM